MVGWIGGWVVGWVGGWMDAKSRFKDWFQQSKLKKKEGIIRTKTINKKERKKERKKKDR